MNIEGVNPTRMELLKLNKKITFAEKGHKLLKEKRDALVMEFFDTIKTAQDLRKSVNEELGLAFKELTMARAVDGERKIDGLALSVGKNDEIQIEARNLMGVHVPKIEVREFIRKVTERGYNLFDSSSRVDKTAKDFELIMNSLLKLAEIEGTLKKIAGEIMKTKRRVNALEYVILPKLLATKKYIQMRLDEVERENFFRLKIIKRRLGE